MHADRITHVLNSNPTHQGEYVLYWMQQSQRVAYNHALEFAIQLANRHHLPLLVVFIVTQNFLGANERHYTFMFEGLQEVKETLKAKGITFAVKIGEFSHIIPLLAKASHSVIFDYGYLRPQLAWRREVLNHILDNKIETNIVLVESDLIVPVRKAYDKVAYGAYVIRPHLHKKMSEYRDFSQLTTVKNRQKINIAEDVDLNDLSFISHLHIDHTVKKTPYFHGGYSHAKQQLQLFIDQKLSSYPLRSDPSLNIQSHMSTYLQFGQISPLEILDRIEKSDVTEAIKQEFIEQLLVRRELAYNYVFYNRDYDRFESMSEPWAYETMTRHENDKRQYIYSNREIEGATTHDKYFNAAMNEMKKTGFMANYMRMYWAKQIILWKKTYQEAYELIVHLNNKYFLDGRNPNSYVNIAWCFGKMDRPWPEKAIWGKLRPMNANGLIRKFNINDYVEQIDKLK